MFLEEKNTRIRINTASAKENSFHIILLNKCPSFFFDVFSKNNWCKIESFCLLSHKDINFRNWIWFFEINNFDFFLSKILEFLLEKENFIPNLCEKLPYVPCHFRFSLIFLKNYSKSIRILTGKGLF